MRKVIAAINMTIDGFCDHTAGIADDELHQHYNELLSKASILLYGRITYQLIFFLLQSCEKHKTGQLTEDYFYYTFNFEKIPLYLFKNELLIEFNNALTKEEINKFLNKFTYFDKQTTERIQTKNKSLRCVLNPEDTNQLKNILKILNTDTIAFAVPVFLYQKNDTSSYMIPLNEILCIPLISDSDFIKLISTNDLEILKSPPESSFYQLTIKNIITGFEPLEIANSLFETGNFKYCHPNMLVNIYLWR